MVLLGVLQRPVLVVLIYPPWPSATRKMRIEQQSSMKVTLSTGVLEPGPGSNKDTNSGKIGGALSFSVD